MTSLKADLDQAQVGLALIAQFQDVAERNIARDENIFKQRHYRSEDW